MKLRILKPA